MRNLTGLARLALLALLAAGALAACASAPAAPPKPKGPLGLSQDNPLHVERMSDEIDYIKGQRCEGGGQWRIGEQKTLPSPPENEESRETAGCSLDKFSVTCSTTGERSAFFFLQCL